MTISDQQILATEPSDSQPSDTQPTDNSKAIPWIVLAIVIVTLLAVGSWYYYNSSALRIAITKEQILERLNETLPLQKTYFYVFDVTFHSPRVELVEASKRINAGLDFTLAITLLNDSSPLQGRVDASAGVRYAPDEGAFYLKEPSVETLELDGVPKELAARAHSVLAQGMSTYFESQPIYQLSERQSHRTAKAVLQDVSIETGRIILHLGPAAGDSQLLPTNRLK